jgi:hypothetical protein
MDRTYTLTLHRDERVGALIEARLHRLTDDGGVALVAVVDGSYAAFGVGHILEALTDELIVYQDEHGELP